jgi:hypothetical protein
MAKQSQSEDMFSSDPFLDEVVGAKPTRQSEYFVPGHYLVQIIDFKRAETRKRRPFIVLETTVLDSDVADLGTGSEASWMQMLDSDLAPANIKNFIQRALNLSEKGVTKEIIAKALAQNPDTGRSFLSGLKIEIVAKEITTKAGTPFTVLNFIAVPADKQDQAKRLADLK